MRWQFPFTVYDMMRCGEAQRVMKKADHQLRDGTGGNLDAMSASRMCEGRAEKHKVR